MNGYSSYKLCEGALERYSCTTGGILNLNFKEIERERDKGLYGREWGLKGGRRKREMESKREGGRGKGEKWREREGGGNEGKRERRRGV